MNVYRDVPIILYEGFKLATADVEEHFVEGWDGLSWGVCLVIYVHGTVNPFCNTFSKVHVFGRDVTAYQGDGTNTLITKGTAPEGFYDIPGGGT